MQGFNRPKPSLAGLSAGLAGLVLFGLAATACTEASDDGAGIGSELAGETDELRFAVDPDLFEEPPALPAEQIPRLLEPEEQMPAIEPDTEVIEEAAEAPDIEILDVADLVDDGPTAEEIASFGDGHTRNATGELVILDEPASLACADAQIALVRLDESRTVMASGHVSSAAERAARSELVEVVAWSDELSKAAGSDGTVDPTVLVGFLAVCIEGGYEL